ncbi:DUF3560 domain-containing protein [Undibacterium sp.]|uniref:DUF3560 domain-containing protein n=1 Tax=Undibacterium sp. TaxID=1914977 RepID=UPI0037522DCA
MTSFNATYSPEDNKLRLYATTRLDKDLYTRAREMGFIWAAKQGLFVAPMWTPARVDFLLELVDEIEDEDKSLVDRSEERAERFEGYQENRTRDANAARSAVSALSDNIPLGQPILVGHHSEARARKDAQRIESGMKKAVSMWETAEYWKSRAAGALHHARYKELPAVRARRIKGIEADKRKSLRIKEESEKYLKAWQRENLDFNFAMKICNFDHVSYCFTLEKFPRNPPASQYEGSMSLYSALSGQVITPAQAAEIAIKTHTKQIARCERWINHYDNRLAYENAMLDEQGGTAANKYDLVVGGKVKIGREWFVITRITRKDGKILSVSTNARYCKVRGVEEIADYQAPTAEEMAVVQAATKLAPMANYPDENTINITQAQWDDCDKDYKGSMTIEATATTGKHRVRKMLGCIADPKMQGMNNRHSYPAVFITDAKRVDPPKKTPAPDTTETTPAEAAPLETAKTNLIDLPLPDPRPAPKEHVQTEFDLMRETLKQGVQVVSAPQLFPTPREIAERVAAEANVEEGMRVLEPSAGTGNLLGALGCKMFGHAPERGEVVAVEINQNLASRLKHEFPKTKVLCSDFLSLQTDEIGQFDRIIMNPPFTNGQDIKHIKHAYSLLKPNGRLVAICMAGNRQKEALMPLVEQSGGIWEPLPANSFMQSGTGVNTVLLTLEK